MSEPHYCEIVHSIEAASILGAEQIIVQYVYVPVGETVNGISYEDYNHMYYKSLEPYCKKFGINSKNGFAANLYINGSIM